MSPEESVDLALARVASAAEDVHAFAVRGFFVHDHPLMEALGVELKALQVARKAYRESYPERRAP